MRAFLYSLALVIFCVGIEMSISALDYLNLVPPERIQVIVPNTQVKMDISALPPGSYFVSMARPRGRCSIYLDGQLVASNYSNLQHRDQLFLSHGFMQGPENNRQELMAECEDRAGVKSTLGSFPLVQTHHLGIAIQMVREAAQIYVGPIFAVIAIISYFFLSFRRSLRADPVFLSMLLSTLVYTLSMTHYFYLFFENTHAALWHYVFRNYFVMNVIACFLPRLSFRRWAPLLAIPVVLSLFLSWSLDPRVFLKIYEFEILGFGLALFVIGFRRGRFLDRESGLISAALMVYGIYHWNAYFPWINFNTVNSLGMVFPVAILASLIYTQWKASQRWMMLKDFDAEMDILIRHATQESEIPTAFAAKMRSMFSRYFGLDRVSGTEQFSREIRNRVRLVPKDDRHRFFRFHQSKRLNIRRHLELLELRDGYRMGPKLRPYHRGGETSLKVSVLILDINNYAKQISLYGPPYADFIQHEFIRKMTSLFDRHDGIVEAVNGDEMIVLFLGSDHLGQESFAERISDVLAELHQFLNHGQTVLTESFMFPAQTISAGFATDDGTLSKESGRYHLKNAPYSRARRIASAATSDSVLLDDQTRRMVGEVATVLLGEPFPVLVKKDFIEVTEVLGEKEAA